MPKKPNKRADLVNNQHFKEYTMWKIVLAFIIFAALAIYLLSKGGDVDMSGEKHGSTTTYTDSTLNT